MRPRLTGPQAGGNSKWHAPGSSSPSQAPPVAGGTDIVDNDPAGAADVSASDSSDYSDSASNSNDGVWIAKDDLSDEEVVEEADGINLDALPDAPIDPVFQETAPANGVLLPVEEFIHEMKDLAYFTYREEFRVTVKGAAKILKQRSDLISRNPATHDSLVRGVVDLHTTRVDACVNGCAALTAFRTTSTVCDVCQTSRQNFNGGPRKQVTYWSLIP